MAERLWRASSSGSGRGEAAASGALIARMAQMIVWKEGILELSGIWGCSEYEDVCVVVFAVEAVVLFIEMDGVLLLLYIFSGLCICAPRIQW